MKKMLILAVLVSSLFAKDDKKPKECFVVIKMEKSYYKNQYSKEDGIPKKDLDTMNLAIQNGYQILPYFYEDEKRSIILQPMIHKSCVSRK